MAIIGQGHLLPAKKHWFSRIPPSGSACDGTTEHISEIGELFWKISLFRLCSDDDDDGDGDDDDDNLLIQAVQYFQIGNTQLNIET